MARKSSKNQFLHPSLFDLPSPDGRPAFIPRNPTDRDDDSLPVHPAIERHAADMLAAAQNQTRVALEGGRRCDSPAGNGDIDELGAISRRRPMMFISFGSGSSGNCSYIGNGDTGFLIDAGVDPKHLESTLLHHAITMDSIAGICLTHDHSDHIQYAYSILRRNRHMRLFCTPKTLNGILRRHNISKRMRDYHTPVYKEFPFRIGPFDIVAFDVWHDGTDNAGFFVSYGDAESPSTMTIATDLGSITDRVAHYMSRSRHIVIESNYDEYMLATGRYPERLKDRIRGSHGHLSNLDAAGFISSIYSPSLRNILLCHLSHDNNTPEKALEAMADALKAAGAGPIGDGSRSLAAEKAAIQLAALPRYDASPLYIFD